MYAYLAEQKLINKRALSFLFTTADLDDLFDIEAELVDVRAKWRQIGSALRLRAPTLNDIEANRCSVEARLSAVLQKWLQKNYNVKRFGEPSWSLVVRAVSHPAGGGDCALALRIATKYGGNVSTQLTTVAL